LNLILLIGHPGRAAADGLPVARWIDVIDNNCGWRHGEERFAGSPGRGRCQNATAGAGPQIAWCHHVTDYNSAEI